MLLRLRNAASSMSELARQQERIANNLANANTVGYRQDRTFTQTLNEHVDAEGAPQSERIVTQWADDKRGALQETGNPLDVALGSDGFFVVSDEETGAPFYTRAGHFQVGEDGTLRTPSGLMVDGEGGPIQVPRQGGAIEIARDGVIRVGEQDVGRLRVVQFEQPMQLRRVEGAMFESPAVEPVAVDEPTVLQGQLESSNVNPLKEMTDMITYFRLFESQQKLLQTSDQILGRVTRDLGTM